MSDSDVNPDRSPGEDQPSAPSPTAQGGSTSPNLARPTDDPHSQNGALKSTRIYAAPIIRIA